MGRRSRWRRLWSRPDIDPMAFSVLARQGAAMSLPSRTLNVEERNTSEPAMVLLHGLAGSWRYWLPAIRDIGGRRRLICPDLLGFGGSPWPDTDYTVDAHLDALMPAVLDRAPQPFDLVGHSLGALLALELAARAPDRIRSLTLLALPYYDDEQQACSLARRELWGRWILDRPKLAKAACAVVCQRRRFWKHVLPPLLPQLPREVVEDGMLHSFQSISSTLRRCVIEHRVDDAAHAVRRAGIRARVVVGDQDLVATRDRAEAFARRYENATVQHIADGDHAFPLTDFRWDRRLLECGCGPSCQMFRAPARRPALRVRGPRP